MGLNINRKIGQSFWINYEIKIIVTEVKGKWAKFRVECADKYDISRTERLENRLGFLGCQHGSSICPSCMAKVVHEIQLNQQRVEEFKQDQNQLDENGEPDGNKAPTKIIKIGNPNPGQAGEDA